MPLLLEALFANVAVAVESCSLLLPLRFQLQLPLLLLLSPLVVDRLPATLVNVSIHDAIEVCDVACYCCGMLSNAVIKVVAVVVAVVAAVVVAVVAAVVVLLQWLL